MIAQNERAKRLDDYLLPYLFGTTDRALSDGRGSRNVTLLRYLLMWLMRFAFQMEEAALAALFGKNRCSIADGVTAVENARESGSWDAVLTEVTEWVERGETLQARIWAGMEHRLEEGSIMDGAKGWKASPYAEGMFRAGMVYRAERPADFPDREAWDDPEADARAANAEKKRKARAEKAAEKLAANKRRAEAIKETSRQPESRGKLDSLLGVLRAAMTDPDLTKALGPVVVSADVASAGSASTWAKPELALRGDRPEVRITSTLGKSRLERADGVITQALRRAGFAALSFGVFQSPGRANTFSTLYKLTEIKAEMHYA